jgi:hypothetical protein
MSWKIKYNDTSDSCLCRHWKFYDVCVYPEIAVDTGSYTNYPICKKSRCPIKIQEEEK